MKNFRIKDWRKIVKGLKLILLGLRIVDYGNRFDRKLKGWW